MCTSILIRKDNHKAIQKAELSGYRQRSSELTEKLNIFNAIGKFILTFNFKIESFKLTREENKQLMLFNLSVHTYDTEKIIAYCTKLSLKYNNYLVHPMLG